MAKPVKAVIKLQIEAGKASPAPPVGPALSQHKVNIMQFTKEYNEKTASMAGMVVPVEIMVHPDSSFTLVLKSPPASVLIKKSLKLDKGASTPGAQVVAKISKKDLLQVAEQKLKDLNARDVESAAKILSGTARSMGVEIESDEGDKDE